VVLEAEVDAQAMEPFLAEGLITEVISLIKSGKEANAYLCRAHPSIGSDYVAAKVYHELGRRNFNRASGYTEGSLILNGQVRRAVAKRSEFGREAEAAIWVDREFDALCTLRDAGADVPEPIACEGRALLMEYLGDADEPAPQLQFATLQREEAGRLLERLLWNVERWLAANYVHGDLSAYNILYHRGRLMVIDFPQAVDPRFAPSARQLLERDLRNLAQHFRRYGVEFDAGHTAADLWARFQYGDL
jgi:RIO kinase 1